MSECCEVGKLASFHDPATMDKASKIKDFVPWYKAIKSGSWSLFSRNIDAIDLDITSILSLNTSQMARAGKYRYARPI